MRLFDRTLKVVELLKVVIELEEEFERENHSKDLREENFRVGLKTREASAPETT